jgi:microcystin-dependent protein
MSEQFMGQLGLFAFGLIPKSWAPCKGQLLQISQNQALFSLLGTFFGGDGITNFALPDLQGRTPLGAGSNAFGNYNVGQKSGEEFHTLQLGEVPQHSHLINVSSNGSSAAKPAGNLPGTTSGGLVPYAQNPPLNAALGAGTIAQGGGGQGHENRQPFLAMSWCIALSGIYPSRS